MIEILTGIAEAVISFITFFGNTILSIIWVITSIPAFVSQVSSIFVFCPSFLLIWLEVSLALTILFAIIKLLK